MSLLAVEIDGEYHDLPTPKVDGLSVVGNELTRASRNMLGNLYKYRVAVKTTVTVQWAALTPEEKNLVLSATGDNSFNLKYYDLMTSTFRYGRFYRGTDLTIRPYPPLINGEFRYYDVGFSMVEF